MEEDIKKWLKEASTIIGGEQGAGEIGGDAVIEEQQQEEISADEEKTAAKKRCFKGLCPNLKLRNQLSKQAEKLLGAVKDLEGRKFDKISYRVIPKDLRLSNKDYEAFQSRTSTLKQVISHLSDPDVNIVGIYGMGGIGKTTLAKEVANRTEASKLFDLVIFVEVTEKPDMREIQQGIAEKFPGLTLNPEETEANRAATLCQRLQNEKKILLILDNIWIGLDVQQTIGFPPGDGRKVLLTSRSVDMLEKTSSQLNFGVELLDDEEAWQLFKKMSRDNIEGSELESVARKVAKKCARLPIVIVTVARALKNKNSFAWNDAAEKLNIKDVNASIELSFNYLETENLKKTILLIGYANITSIDKLLMYGKGVALYEDVNKIEGRRDRVLTLVQQLKDSCLLLDSNTADEDFSMHDVVREVAISVASRDHQVFTKLHDVMESLEKNALKVCHSIVLKDVKTVELPQVLQCQQLKLLSVSGVHSDSLKLHDEFFMGMTELKVLVLDHVDLLSPPSSLRFLKNLRALGLYDCRLDDIAIIGDLKKLEILSLKNSVIEKLPVEVGGLPLLKSLDLRGCFPLGVIAPYFLSSLSHLEELYMGDFSGWEEGLNKDRKNVSLDELKHLLNLTCLEIQIKHAKTLPRDLFFNKLERYQITIGENRGWIWNSKCCRSFSLSLMDTNICLNDGHIMQLKKIEGLCLVGSQDMKNVLYGLDRDGFQQLKYLQVRNNDNLLCIVDAMKYASNNAFPVLELLLIRKLVNLEKICHGRLATESSFSKLREIVVENCAKLENIFPFSIARRLQLLRSIDVSGCENMKEIFGIESKVESDNNISEVIDNIELKQLRSLHLYSLPQLKSLEYNSNCSNTLFSGKVAFPSLEKLELSYCNNLKRVFSSSMIGSFDQLQYLKICNCPGIEEIMDIDDKDELRTEDRKNNVAFPSLEKLELSYCNNLKRVFSSSMIGSFDQLQYLKIYYCPGLEEIMDIDDEDELRIEERKNNVAFPSLEKLELTCCNNLKHVFSSSMFGSFDQLQYLEIYHCHGLEEIMDIDDEDELRMEERKNNVAFPSLEKLELSYCNNLKHVFSSSMIGSFDKLQYLSVRGCPTIDGLGIEDGKNNVAFPSLEKLELSSCNNLKCVFSSSMIRSFDQLQYLKIYNCPGLEEIMEIDDEDELRTEERKNNVAFPSLEKLELSYCNNLKHVFSSSMIGSFDQLQYLKIYNCPGLVEIMDIDDEDELRTEERKTNVAFPSLEKLELSCCNNLKHVFSSSMIGSFDQLQYLEIYECPALEEIMVIDDKDGLRTKDGKNSVRNCHDRTSGRRPYHPKGAVSWSGATCHHQHTKWRPISIKTSNINWHSSYIENTPNIMQ